MSYQLKIDEMLDALVLAGHPQAHELTKQTEALADTLAAAVCKHFDVWADAASFEGVAFAGTCVPFYSDGPLPDGLRGYDDENEWGA
jgi:hypothetical protein